MGAIEDSVRLVGGVMDSEVNQAAAASEQARKQAKMAEENAVGQMRGVAEREAFSRDHTDVVRQAQSTMHNGAQAIDASEMVIRQQPEWDGVDEVGYNNGMQLG